MKEFGVEFEIENEDFEDDDDGFTEPYFDYRLWEIESPETISSLLDVLDCNGRIYVQSGNNHIFEPKEGDLALLDKKEPCFAYKHSLIHKDRMSIIVRDNKQFFMPEVQND